MFIAVLRKSQRGAAAPPPASQRQSISPLSTLYLPPQFKASLRGNLLAACSSEPSFTVRCAEHLPPPDEAITQLGKREEQTKSTQLCQLRLQCEYDTYYV
ncbi:hypothetical protein EVAR_27689_1 [Eumeta japonica]|uniref:Uncharacterized protein n=1 Tax=Eumeta variegata TaxID=151549 RepID=A0A4C1WRL1_EUMVA|nr:hypothetical protein EVAR_27689_1 [Eumeta japonica]